MTAVDKRPLGFGALQVREIKEMRRNQQMGLRRETREAGFCCLNSSSCFEELNDQR